MLCCFKKLFYVLGFYFLAAFFCHKATDGFMIDNIQGNSSLYLNEIKDGDFVLNQKETLSYLGSGRSCYAFENKDKTMVVKFFKKHHFSHLGFGKGFPSRSWLYRSPETEKKRFLKFERVARSAALAASVLKEETGVIALQMGGGHSLPRKLTLIDKIGVKYPIDSDTMDAIIQKKAILANVVIKKLIKEDRFDEVDKAFSLIATLFAQVEAKGFSILDPRIETNVGFCEGVAILIDVGCIVPKEVAESRFRSLKSFERFLINKDPRILSSYRENFKQFFKD